MEPCKDPSAPVEELFPYNPPDYPKSNPWRRLFRDWLEEGRPPPRMRLQCAPGIDPLDVQVHLSRLLGADRVHTESHRINSATYLAIQWIWSVEYFEDEHKARVENSSTELSPKDLPRCIPVNYLLCRILARDRTPISEQDLGNHLRTAYEYLLDTYSLEPDVPLDHHWVLPVEVRGKLHTWEDASILRIHPPQTETIIQPDNIEFLRLAANATERYYPGLRGLWGELEARLWKK